MLLREDVFQIYPKKKAVELPFAVKYLTKYENVAKMKKRGLI
jgi:hypothetical protein